MRALRRTAYRRLSWTPRSLAAEKAPPRHSLRGAIYLILSQKWNYSSSGTIAAALATLNVWRV